MKRTAVLFFFLLAVSTAFTQIRPTSQSGEYRNIFKLSPSQFTTSTFQLGVEHFMSPVTSLYLAAGVNFMDRDFESSWGIRSEVQVKLHAYTVIKPLTSSRIYFAPYLTNMYMNASTEVFYPTGSEWIDDTYDAIGLGMIVGYSYSFANRINIDIYTGGGLRKAFNTDHRTDDELFTPAYSGIAPRLGVDLGFWF